MGLFDSLQSQPAQPGQESLLDMFGGIAKGGLSNLVSLGRGAAATVAGAPGDLETGGRALLNALWAKQGGRGQAVSPDAALPTSDFYKQWMPFQQNRPESAGMTELGTIFSPFAEKALGTAASVAKDAALSDVGYNAVNNYVNAMGMQANAFPKINGVRTTVDAQRLAYPKIYDNPAQLVSEAASRVAPEDPALKQLFGVTRDDLWQIGKQGTRQGNLLDVPYKLAENPRGADASFAVMNNQNAGRLQDIIGEAMDHPNLYQPMASWYVNDPLYPHFQRLFGDGASDAFNQFNALTGMSSPGSEVLTELNRGTAANWLRTQGRWDDFMKYGGYGVDRRAGDPTFPADMAGVMGHPYHSTAQAPAMDKYLSNGGVRDMGSAKVPSYIDASGTPEVGFQTDYPVADAHYSRLVGLSDTRNPMFNKGQEVLPKQSASVSEVATLTPWWRDNVAEPMGLKAVPAQAVVWGAGSGATGVTSPIGAPKLELLAQQIMGTSRRLGISPEQARDMVLSGKTYAGDGKGIFGKLLDD